VLVVDQGFQLSSAAVVATLVPKVNEHNERAKMIGLKMMTVIHNLGDDLHFRGDGQDDLDLGPILEPEADTKRVLGDVDFEFFFFDALGFGHWRLSLGGFGSSE